jgi:hypothetical protein
MARFHPQARFARNVAPGSGMVFQENRMHSKKARQTDGACFPQSAAGAWNQRFPRATPYRHCSEEVTCIMKLELTTKQFRRLLDMVYIGNWILNSTRGEDRFQDYDKVESLLFSKARAEGMGALAEVWNGEVIPSRAFAEGGIHEAIMEYENNVFFDILAEDLARRDMDDAPIDESNYDELNRRIDAYIAEFEEHGTDNILVDSDSL